MQQRHILILFGATGDLSLRKLIPAFCELVESGECGELFLIATSLTPYDTEGYVSFLADHCRDIRGAAPRISYYPGDCTDPALIATLEQAVASLESRVGVCQRIVYCATSYRFFLPITEGCARFLRASDCIAYEKPFGAHATHARELYAAVRTFLAPEQCYFVDHYAAKKRIRTLQVVAIQGDRPAIREIRINLYESLTVGARGALYEQLGAFRDMIQGHGLALAAKCLALLVGGGLQSQAALKLLRPRAAYAGQYEGYHDEEGVASDSRVETAARIECVLEYPGWEDVVMSIATAKGSVERVMAIEVAYTRQPHIVMSGAGESGAGERMSALGWEYKDGVSSYSLDDESRGCDAYVTVLRDLLSGGQQYAATFEEMEECWRIIDEARALCATEKRYVIGTPGNDIWGK